MSKRRLTRLERAIVDAVRVGLADADRAIWDAQVAAIYRVQRLPGGVEVNLYMRGAAAGTLPRLSRRDDFEIAHVTVSLPTFNASIQSTVWCVAGRLFSIEYKVSADYFEEVMGMDPLPNFGVEATVGLIRPGPAVTD